MKPLPILIFLSLFICPAFAQPAGQVSSAWEAPASIAGWLACLGFVLWIVNLGFKLGDRLRGKPAQPSNTSLGATVTDMNRRVTKLEDWREALAAKLEADKIEIMSAGEERAAKIHERINTVLSAVSEVRGEIKHIKR